MKAKVNRRLSSGFYHVNFEVGEFTADELQKMASFGIPKIKLLWGGAGSMRLSGDIALNQITKTYDIGFSNEAEAKKYEETVVAQIREAAQRLRESHDQFSSSDEVAL
jgi:hypothetical protein